MTMPFAAGNVRLIGRRPNRRRAGCWARRACAIVIAFLPVHVARTVPIVRGDVLIGPIDQDFVNRFAELSAKYSDVTIASSGGDAANALDVADLIRSRRTRIHIVAACVSGCAEIIMPAASKWSALYMMRRPIIAYHRNPDIARDEFRQLGRRDFMSCYGPLWRRYRRFERRVGIPSKAWRLQEGILRLDMKKGQKTDSCADFNVNLVNSEWLPSSDQLRQILNLKFQGAVCADQDACVRDKIYQMVDKGVRYVVGQKCLIVSGDRILGYQSKTCP